MWQGFYAALMHSLPVAARDRVMRQDKTLVCAVFAYYVEYYNLITLINYSILLAKDTIGCGKFEACK